MTTTHLFVELLVIGFGAFFGLLLLVAAAAGLQPDAGAQLLVLEALFPVLAIVYVFGILMDRLADILFDWADKGHRERFFGDRVQEYYFARRSLVMDAENLWRDLEYGRSRLRICRGWALNSLLLWASFNYYIWKLYGNAYTSASWFWIVNFLLPLLAAGCFGCWWRLNSKEYQKVERLGKWLKEERALDLGKVDFVLAGIFEEMRRRGELTEVEHPKPRAVEEKGSKVGGHDE